MKTHIKADSDLFKGIVQIGSGNPSKKIKNLTSSDMTLLDELAKNHNFCFRQILQIYADARFPGDPVAANQFYQDHMAAEEVTECQFCDENPYPGAASYQIESDASQAAKAAKYDRIAALWDESKDPPSIDSIQSFLSGVFLIINE